MNIIKGWRGIDAAARGAAIAIGNFDGVHKGHQAVLNAAQEAAQARGLKLAAAVFDPHPRRFFRPDAPPFRLMSDRLRAEILAMLGVEILYVLPFDRDFSQLSDTDFAASVLKDGLGAAHVIVGADFRFGRGRAGDTARLAALGEAHGFGVTAVAPAGDGGMVWSSTAARAALAEGAPEVAAAILGRPWIVDGEVRAGLALGRTYGVPTANLEMGGLLHPRLGVYAVRARIAGAGDWLPGAASIGVRPTVGGTETLLEVHLLDRDADLYGRRMDVAFHAFLRDEVKFASVEEMAAQIERDIEACRAILGGPGQ